MRRVFLGMVYAALLQAGVDRVELSSGFQSGALQHFGGRVKVIGIDGWSKANNRICTAFQHVSPKVHNLDNFPLLFLFLTELMNALDTHCHVGWTDQVPTRELCDEFITDDASNPYRQLTVHSARCRTFYRYATFPTRTNRCGIAR